LARRKVRRSVIDVIWAVAAAAALLVLIFGYERYTADRSVLDSDAYQQLRIGQDQTSVHSRLPAYQATGDNRPQGAPPDPPGTDECRFYRTRARAVSPVYRLCFTAGTLSHKDELTIDQT
ncbi:MAG: sensor histidine kinase, partial [Stackebrandtia sp.]